MKLVFDGLSARVLGIHMLGADAAAVVQRLAVAITCDATKRDFDRTVAVHPMVAAEFMLMRDRVPHLRTCALALGGNAGGRWVDRRARTRDQRALPLVFAASTEALSRRGCVPATKVSSPWFSSSSARAAASSARTSWRNRACPVGSATKELATQQFATCSSGRRLSSHFGTTDVGSDGLRVLVGGAVGQGRERGDDQRGGDGEVLHHGFL